MLGQLKSKTFVNPCIAVGLGLFVVFSLTLIKFQGNITGFFRIGEVLPVSPLLHPQTPFIHSGKTGHDGQQFLTIALDPSLHYPETLKSLDVPAYRYRRIFYPFLGWLLGVGQSALIPLGLVVINVACLGVAVWGLGQLLPTASSLPLLFLAIPGVWISLSISTADLLSSTLVILALVSFRRSQVGLSLAWQALALLTRETTILIWLTLVLTSGFQRQKKYLFLAPLPLIPWGAWNLYLRVKLPGQWDSQSLGTHFSWPLLGIFDKISELLATPWTMTQALDGIVFGLQLVIVVGVILCAKPAWKHQRELMIGAGLYSVVFLLSKLQILALFTDYSRVYLDLYLFWLLLWPVAPKPYFYGTFVLMGLVSIAYLVGFTIEPV